MLALCCLANWRLGINLLDKNLITIHKLEEPEGLQSYRKNFQETYEALKQTYNKSLALHKTDPTQYPRTLEEPLLPNRLEAYAGDLFGLDLAKRDCRLEMIKIVKEVSQIDILQLYQGTNNLGG